MGTNSDDSKGGKRGSLKALDVARLAAGVMIGSPETSLGTAPPIPPILQGMRDQCRKMMRARCQQPGSPIPLARADDWGDFVFLLVMTRSQVRIAAGKPAFDSQEAMQNDIVRAAETSEIVIATNIDEAVEDMQPVIKPAGLRLVP